MDSPNLTADFRIYRPASILVIDLVRHSTRAKDAVQFLQRNLEEVLATAQRAMKLEDVHFNYTGDGYVCAFIGDASARIMDFVNFALPELRRRFSQSSQQIRVGLDFGLIHLTENELTKGTEHFDLVGVRAARLEASAEPDQILCTETVYRIFGQHYPQMFRTQPRAIQTKDVEILAYEVLAYDCAELQSVFAAYLFRSMSVSPSLVGRRKRLLIVDDEPHILDSLADLFREEWPDLEIVTASSAEDALGIWRPKEFLLVLTDCIMPGMSGHELTQEMIGLDAEQSVVMITGFASIENAVRFMQVGGTDYVAKPFRYEEINEVMRQAITGQSLQAVRNRLGILSENIGNLLMLLRGVSGQLHTILGRVKDPDDIAHGLLRHKAKHLVNEFVKSILPGQDITGALAILQTQLRCVERLSNIVGRVQVGDIENYLDRYVADLQDLHRKVEFKLFSNSARDQSVTIASGTELILITCELIDNALYALKHCGKIEISISTLKTTGLVRITVKDNGPGVPADLEGRIFEEGISTKGDGRGLGLSLVREAVRVLNGEIRYQNSDGAEFQVLLPLR